MKNLLSAASQMAIAVGLMTTLPSAIQADIVHLDDTIITFSLCVGNDCVNGESFGFDTMRLKENNLRIHFQDTSNSASFPTNDWRITINDSSNGGSNYFAIDDVDAGRTPFRVDAGAPTNAVRVDSAGDLGLGTANPVVDLHVVSGNTPTLRLEQDGSSGFAAQTFDIAANEANFFVRDVTNGSELVFRIQPGADENSLFIANDNDIGMGTNAPSTALHIRRTNGGAGLRVEELSGTEAPRGLMHLANNGQIFMGLEDTSVTAGNHSGRIWNIQNVGGQFMITTAPGSDTEFQLDPNGNLTLGGTVTTTGTTCNGGCDLVFTDAYDLPSIEDHAENMFSLGYLPNVGPTIENAPINVTEKLGGMLNELEHAHIYIAQQQSRLVELEMRLAALEAGE